MHLRGIEHWRMPDGLRKIAASSMPDPFARSTELPDGREAIFLHVPKTAGTSLAAALDLRPGHIPVSRYIAKDRLRFENAFSFAFVRNPWDRLRSSFGYLRSAFGINASPDVLWAEENLAPFGEFEQFVLALKDPKIRSRIMRWKHFQPQLDWLAMPGERDVLANFVGKFERIGEETIRLGSEIGVELDVPHLRKPQAYLEENRFTPEMIGIIGDIYAADATAFGYVGPV